MITTGVLLIETDALRPRCFEVEATSHPNGWMSLKQTLTPKQLEEELSASGWTFFFMAGPVRTRAFGFDREKALNAALKRAIKVARQQRCNCLQVESVDMKSFVGVLYVSLSLRLRHIQTGVLFTASLVGAETSITAHELRRNVAAT